MMSSNEDRFRWLKRRDEEDETSMAALAFALNDIEEETRSIVETDDVSDLLDRPPPSSLASFHLPSTLTPESVIDLLAFFSEEPFVNTLHPFYFRRLLRDARTSFLATPPLVRVNDADDDSVHIVGDLHGSLADLVHIFDLVGFPGEENRNVFVFNGDLVDRGDHSVEVLATVLAMKVAHPHHVFLNRGNHEDHAMSMAYGFQDEIEKKFPTCQYALWRDVRALFGSLPFATILPRYRAFVCHGGPPPLDRSLEDVERIMSTHRDRDTVLSEDGDDASIILQDLLWSDPDVASSGTRFNESRNCGKAFGTDVVSTFLRRNGLLHFVRSHECVYDGVTRVVCDNDAEEVYNLFTVFSATNYPNHRGFNSAGLLTFENGATDPIARSFESDEMDDADEDSETMMKNRYCFETSLRRQIFLHRNALRGAFESKVVDRPGRIHVREWCDTMTKVLGIELDWTSLRPFLTDVVKRASMDPKTNVLRVVDTDEIRIDDFLGRFSSSDVDETSETDEKMETMFRHQRQLARLFSQLDADGSGEISRDEFLFGVKALNKRLDPDARICADDESRISRLFDRLDEDESGSIDIAEFAKLESYYTVSFA